jgi:hypothetical protein
VCPIGGELPPACEVEVFLPASKNFDSHPAPHNPLVKQQPEFISYSICFHAGTSFVFLFRNGGHSKVFFSPVLNDLKPLRHHSLKTNAVIKTVEVFKMNVQPFLCQHRSGPVQACPFISRDKNSVVVRGQPENQPVSRTGGKL